MGAYNFATDLNTAQKTEYMVANLLEQHYSLKILEICKTNAYDILVSTNGKNRIAIEIKEDFLCRKTGNIALEFGSRSKPSGIQTTQAEYYIYVIHEVSGVTFWLTKKRTFEKMIIDAIYSKIINGGDRNSNTLNYLFDLNVFKSYSMQLFV